MTNGQKISFQYYEYTPAKEKRLRHDGLRYVFSPYCMIWNNDSYYSVGFSDQYQKIAKFRVDRMEDLRILQDRQVPVPEDFDVSEYFSQEFSMLDGAATPVELLCDNVLMNSIIDRFGEGADTEVVDGKHFKVRATVDLSSNFYGWVFASAGKMRIVGPPEAVNGFQTTLQTYAL